MRELKAHSIQREESERTEMRMEGRDTGRRERRKEVELGENVLEAKVEVNTQKLFLSAQS